MRRAATLPNQTLALFRILDQVFFFYFLKLMFLYFKGTDNWVVWPEFELMTFQSVAYWPMLVLAFKKYEKKNPNLNLSPLECFVSIFLINSSLFLAVLYGCIIPCFPHVWSILTQSQVWAKNALRCVIFVCESKIRHYKTSCTGFRIQR